MIKIGIIGLGFMAATHIRACESVENATIAAICNPSGRNLDGDLSDVSGNLGDGKPVVLDMSQVTAYRNIADLLADPDIDLIDICTPTFTHLEIAVAALKAGKHVLCEKPLARTSTEAEQIIEATTTSRGWLMPAMCLRFAPEWAFVKRAIDAGTYGKVEAARFRRIGEPPAWGQKFFLDGKKSGGALLDLHIHDVDFIQHCFGMPQSVFASGYSKVSGATDYVVCQYSFDSGVTVHAEGGWNMSDGFGFNMAYTLNFENATVDYDMSRTDSLRVYENGKEPQMIKCETELDGYASEIQHMVNAIENDIAPTAVTAEDGLRALLICEAEEQSVQSGQPVTL